MRFDIISILPKIFAGFSEFGVCGRALQNGAAQAQFWNPRDYAKDRHRTVDDRPFGGGCGMVMLAEPLAGAIESAKEQNSGDVIYLSPRGEVFNDALARQLATQKELILICGRYRGVDERVINTYATRCISVGDYILSGGEVAAMALIDAVLRHCPGVLGDADSVNEESFAEGILDAPCWTRPEVWREQEAPKVLLSGNHKATLDWRRKAAEELTRHWRPDLLCEKK
ncbi:MAG: tRNA (guanosine(37)-N1)-methyltransferase TrmD [Gammaproteobacteria bacterium WSBS_2016_MAG_OTU1]